MKVREPSMNADRAIHVIENDSDMRAMGRELSVSVESQGESEYSCAATARLYRQPGRADPETADRPAKKG
jgi:hypothetical protein